MVKKWRTGRGHAVTIVLHSCKPIAQMGSEV